MPIRYRAVQADRPWRKVNHHTSVANAIDGSRGAVNLLLSRGLQREKVAQYGEAIAVFVWDTESAHGWLLRRDPADAGRVARIEIPVTRLEALDDSEGVTPSEIQRLVAEFARVDG